MVAGAVRRLQAGVVAGPGGLAFVTSAVFVVDEIAARAHAGQLHAVSRPDNDQGGRLVGGQGKASKAVARLRRRVGGQIHGRQDRAQRFGGRVVPPAMRIDPARRHAGGFGQRRQ